MDKSNQININKTVTEAFRGFKSWWIPICGITTTIFLSQSCLPHFLFNNLSNKEKLHELKLAFAAVKDKAIATGDPNATIEQFKTSIIHLYNDPGMHVFLNILLVKVICILAVISLFLCFLYVIVIIISKKSLIDNDKFLIKKCIKKSYHLSFSYFGLCVIKAIMLLLPFLVPTLYLLLKLTPTADSQQDPLIYYHVIELIGVLFLTIFLILLSMYTYIRLYFTGFVITENSANPFKAIAKSWKLTRNNTKKLSVIFILTIIIDIVSVVSIIGFIPGTGLKYTLRASAYKQCLNR